MTKIDVGCELVNDDVSEVTFSPTVLDYINKASTAYGLPPSQIFPVKNYENEMDLDTNVGILSMFSLRQILQYADGYFLNCLDITKD